MITALNWEAEVETAGPDMSSSYLSGGFLLGSTVIATDTTYDNGWAFDGLSFPALDVDATYADFHVVPVPAAVWLFGSCIVALGAVARRCTKTMSTPC